jgi:hypothetical protein
LPGDLHRDVEHVLVGGDRAARGGRAAPP